MLFDLRSDLAEELHEVMLHDAHHVAAISNDLGIGEVTLDHRAIRRTQVDTDQTHPLPAFQGVKEAFESGGAFTFDHIDDFVVAQITEGGGEATAPVESVFVNTKFERAFEANAFTGLTVSVLLVDALDRRTSQISTGSHRRSTDALVMKFVDIAAEQFSGVPAGAYTLQWLDEASGAGQTPIASAMNEKRRFLSEAFEMTDTTLVSALAVEAYASTARAVLGPSHGLGCYSKRRLALISDYAVSFQSY